MGEEFAGLGSNVFFAFRDDEQFPSGCRVFTLKLDHADKANSFKNRVITTDIPNKGFSFSGTCELADGAEAEALRDMMRREMPEKLFDVHILPSLYKKCCGRAPRKILKAMNHGGYYRRNTKWKRKAIALYNRYPEQSPFTIGRAKMKIEDNGEVLILGRSVSKTQVLKQRRSRLYEEKQN